MREQEIFCVLLICLSCAFADLPEKNCGDCTRLHQCSAAYTLFNNKDASSDAKLKPAFCGYDDDEEPKVCCSELSTADASTSATGGNIEDHQNLSLLPDSCGDILGDKIIGGHEARLNEYPWMALLSFNTRDGLKFQCGGSLINNRYVLTAAHCLDKKRLAGVRLGEHDINNNDEDCQGEPPNRICGTKVKDVRVERIITHPEYTGPMRPRNDIALLRLKKTIYFAPNARPICLPVTSAMQSRDVVGFNATVAGWGFTETDSTSSKLLAVDVPVHTQDECRGFYHSANRYGEEETKNKLCAGKLDADSCRGDSGGPLMVKGTYKGGTDIRFIQQGIVSYGPGRCGSERPGIYTDISKYMTWILDNIEP